MKHSFKACAPLLLVATGLAAQERASVDSLQRVAETVPLFGSHDLLELRIDAPLTTIFKDRDQESDYHPGTLSYVDERGDSVALDMRAKTRGFFRLKRRTCNFPNMHINFRRRQVENTVFADQNRVAIVTHCQDKKPEYEQFTLEEYLIYRTLNLLTDKSVRVRLGRATYFDTDGERDSLTKYMFFLEPFDMLATRHGGQVFEVRFVPPNQQDQYSLILVEVFQYFIGNTDWSLFQASASGNCCHNARVIGKMGEPVIPVPYDFDWSGVISAPYAKPNPEVGTKRVRERKYLGICHPPEALAPVLALFNDRRESIYDLWRGQEGLDRRRLERTLEYFDEFYEIINDEGKTKREILLRCRKVQMNDASSGQDRRQTRNVVEP